MLRKGFVVLIVLGLMFSAAAVFAIDPEKETIQVVDTDSGYMMRYTDGRLNDWDLIAPVAVYYTKAMVPKTDAEGNLLLLADGRKEYVNQVVSLDFWGLDPDTGFITHLIHLPIDDVHAMTETATQAIELATAKGYQVGFSPDFGGWYWVTAPADASGNAYVFKWQE